MRRTHLIRHRKPPIAEVIRLDGSSLAFASHDTPHFKPFWHYHPELEFTFITSGSGTRFVGDSVENFVAGDLVFMGRNLPHSWVTPRPVKSLVIQFLPEFLGSSFLSVPEARRLHALFERARRGMKLEGRTQARVAELMFRMNGERHGSLTRVASLLLILEAIAASGEYRLLAVAPFEPSRARGAPRQVNAVLQRVYSNPVDVPSQSEMARSIGMSPQAFSRFFRKNVRLTYSGFVNEYRVSLASKALADGGQKIIDIAYACGFKNLSSFNLQFKRIRGKTPRDYRRAARQGLQQDS